MTHICYEDSQSPHLWRQQRKLLPLLTTLSIRDIAFAIGIAGFAFLETLSTLWYSLLMYFSAYILWKILWFPLTLMAQFAGDIRMMTWNGSFHEVSEVLDLSGNMNINSSLAFNVANFLNLLQYFHWASQSVSRFCLANWQHVIYPLFDFLYMCVVWFLVWYIRFVLQDSERASCRFTTD